MKNSFTNCPPCLLAEMAKVASLVARPPKCYINRLEQFIWRHIRNGSTNQIAGNSLFSSEIILNRGIKCECSHSTTETKTRKNSGFEHDSIQLLLFTSICVFPVHLYMNTGDSFITSTGRLLVFTGRQAL